MADHDVLIIGAGFAGMYQLHLLRQRGFAAHVVEAGDDVGGTWYWNRYPGARCDIESVEYSFSFDEELQQEWAWSERYAAQPELLSYARHVADRFDLRKDITFNQRVRSLAWKEAERHWVVTAEDGSTRTAQHVIAATGCLSVPSRPTFPAMDGFGGDLLWTSDWPADADLTGKRVAVIGTGSSGLQTITVVAREAGELTVFQRTPCYAVPAHNGPIADLLASVKERYADLRADSRMAPSGYQCAVETEALIDIAPDETRPALDKRWDVGGLCFADSLSDVLIDPAANHRVSEYVRTRIKEKVFDPAVAAKLLPTFPIAAKRLCVDTGYYEVYNQPNVSLVDVNEAPIERFTERGILAGGTEHAFDVIIMATGFDAMTGALNSMEIRNGRDQTLSEKWAHGPRTYLGLMSAGFPNLFTICGPQSPSVLSNMITSIEQHVEWISDALDHLRAEGLTRIEASVESEDSWVTTTNDLANLTLMPQAASWYMGANIPGKERVFMPFVGGVGLYRQVADGVAVSGYHGFELA